MKVDVGGDRWGYYITHDLIKKPIFPDTDVPNKHVVVLKEKQYIQDLGRTVVNTTYYFTEDDRLNVYDKRGVSDILTELMIDYMRENGKMIYDSKIGKETKNVTTIEFQPDEYDTYYLKVRREDIDGDDPSTYVRRLNPAGQKPEPTKKPRSSTDKEVVDTFSVKGSSDTYTVRKFSDGSWDCSCPHYMYRLQSKDGQCKHIRNVR